VPLPAIRRHRTTLKRRRAAAILTTAAAAVAVIAAVLPGAINTSTPDPAKPPPDYTRDGITIPGMVGTDRLEKAEIGKPGAAPLTLNWTPAGNSVRFRVYCRTDAATKQRVQVTVNGRFVGRDECGPKPTPTDENVRFPGDILWLEAPPGKAAKVRVFVVDAETGTEEVAAAQLALGIYRTPDTFEPPAAPALTQLPVRALPDAPGDYVRGGLRFRAKVAGDTLLGATIGEPGQRSLKLQVTATTRSTGLRVFCTANKTGRRMELDVSIGQVSMRVPCFSGHADIALDNEGQYRLTASPRGTVDVTVNLADESAGDLRIGVGAYAMRPPRVVQTATGHALLDEVLEYGGQTYQLAKVVTGDPKSARPLSLDTPGGKPYLVAFRNIEAGQETVAQVAMRSQKVNIRPGQLEQGPSRYISTWGQSAGAAGQATMRIIKGRPTKGTLLLSLYLPE
jgi:hypothetical protein